MIASTVLQDAVSRFLLNVARYTGIPFCLKDHEGDTIVQTPADEVGGYGSEIGYSTERKINLRDMSLWHLYTMDDPIPGTELLREQVLDFAAEVVLFIINNEEEMQNLSTELLERYQELHVLYDVINDVSSVLDENDICAAVLRKAMQTLDVASGAVVYVDTKGTQRVRCKQDDDLVLNDEDLMRYADRVRASRSHMIISKSHADAAQGPAVLAVPVVVNNASIGAMIVSAKHTDGDFTSGDRISLSALAGYLGIAITSAQLIKAAQDADALRREFDFARKIQQSLLPKQLPAMTTLDIAARCIPATEVGGDLFMFLQTGPEEWTLGVADVAGHGLGAAFILASLRSILRSECRRGISMEESIRSTNDILCEDTQGSELFATLFLGTYNNATRTLRSVNAGHPPGLLWRAASQRVESLEQGGMAVGLFTDERYDYDEQTLSPGDALLLYTDGIIESKSNSGELFGLQRLHNCLALHVSLPAEQCLQQILNDVAVFHDGVRQLDDVTIIMVKVR